MGLQTACEAGGREVFRRLLRQARPRAAELPYALRGMQLQQLQRIQEVCREDGAVYGRLWA